MTTAGDRTRHALGMVHAAHRGDEVGLNTLLDDLSADPADLRLTIYTMAYMAAGAVELAASVAAKLLADPAVLLDARDLAIAGRPLIPAHLRMDAAGILRRFSDASATID